MYTAPPFSGGSSKGLTGIEGGPEGISGIMRRVYTVRGEIAANMERGLIKAGQFLKMKSQEVVPVDTGALKASAFVKKIGSGFKTQVEVGYDVKAIRSGQLVSYAIYVHERLDQYHKPGTYARFLSRPSIEYRPQMIDIIRREAQKGF